MADRLNDALNAEFAKSVKIGLVGTIDETGGPHVTVLSTLMGRGEDVMCFGKFVEGLSKEFVLKRPRAGFLIMNPEKKFWRGTMDYDHLKKEGPEYEFYNDQPLYRYNAYFGINTVYYFNLRNLTDGETLPMGKVIGSAIRVLFRKKRYARPFVPAMKPWAEGFLAKLDTLKFLSWIDADGYPTIVPTIQAQAASPSTVVLRDDPYAKLLAPLAQGTRVALLGFSMTMETVLVKGVFSGFDDDGFGTIAIDRVYNSMPPVHGYVYPEDPIRIPN